MGLPLPGPTVPWSPSDGSSQPEATATRAANTVEVRFLENEAVEAAVDSGITCRVA
jgi:hypothetical protein